MKYYKLHLIRHGLTAGNLQGLYIGSGTDLPLCAEGRAQLQELKAQFRYPEVSLVFTSPLLRATQTADVLFPGVRQSELRFYPYRGAAAAGERPRVRPVDGPHQPCGARGGRGPAGVF